MIKMDVIKPIPEIKFLPDQICALGLVTSLNVGFGCESWCQKSNLLGKVGVGGCW
jgi:hypothetical protein